MKKTKTALSAVAVLLLALTAAVATCFVSTVSAAWDGGLTDGNEESAPLPFPRGNTDESGTPVPDPESMPESGGSIPGNDETVPEADRETDRQDTDGDNDRTTDRVTEGVTDAAAGTETTETEKKAGLSFWAVLGAAGCAAAVAGIVLAVTNKAEKKH